VQPVIKVFDLNREIETSPVSGPSFTALADMRFPAIPGLLRNSSIELSTNGEEAIRSASEILPPGMGVYVPKMPRQTLSDKLVQIGLLRKYGLNPIPHIVARQLSSEEELSAFLAEAVRTGGVRRVLVIGGDDKVPLGPYRDSAAVLTSGMLTSFGIDTVDVAGYPDGHPVISSDILLADLEAKVVLAKNQGFSLNVVTQFSFEPDNIVAYCADLAMTVPEVPVYAGLVGPTSPAKLLRFAKICGVSTSMRAANKLGMNALKLASHASPDKQFEILAQHKEAGETGNLAGIHLFSFGGFVDSSQWLDDKARSAGVRS
jgi:methylenetetrahydrofolate reductase (NADPH)